MKFHIARHGAYTVALKGIESFKVSGAIFSRGGEV